MKRSIKVGPLNDVSLESEGLCWGEALREDACGSGVRYEQAAPPANSLLEVLRKLLEGVTR